MVNLWMRKHPEANSKGLDGRNSMELEMFLDGKFIDSVAIKESDLKRIDELQHKMEKKHCNQLKYSDGQPQFFISGMSEEDVQLRSRVPGK